MLWSLFMQRGFSAFGDAVDDPQYSDSILLDYCHDSRVNIVYKGVYECSLEDTDTFQIPMPIDIGNAPTEDCVIILKVVGQIKVTWTGKDYDNATSRTGYLFSKGSVQYPGILILQSYNFDKSTGLLLTAGADDTRVEIFVGVKCDDDDARLTTNA